MKQLGVISRTADQRVSILKWCFSMCWLSPFKFKIKRYLPLFFFRTNIVDMYSPGECTAGSKTPSSSRWVISKSIISFSFESNWISGLGRLWCGSLISRWQCCTMSSIYWSVVILDQAGKKCLSLPANFLVVKLTWIGFEFSHSSSSPPASFWSGGALVVFWLLVVVATSTIIFPLTLSIGAWLTAFGKVSGTAVFGKLGA